MRCTLWTIEHKCKPKSLASSLMGLQVCSVSGYSLSPSFLHPTQLLPSGFPGSDGSGSSTGIAPRSAAWQLSSPMFFRCSVDLCHLPSISHNQHLWQHSLDKKASSGTPIERSWHQGNHSYSWAFLFVKGGHQERVSRFLQPVLCRVQQTFFIC